MENNGLFLGLILTLISPVYGQLVVSLGDAIWNNRYGTEPGYVAYSSEDRVYGLWSHHVGFDEYIPFPFTGLVCSGCSCLGGQLQGCSAGTVAVRGYSFNEISQSAFQSPTVMEIYIQNIASLTTIEPTAFNDLPNLNTLAVYDSPVEALPDVSNFTALQRLAFVTTDLYDDGSLVQVFPSSLTHVALIRGRLRSIPHEWFSAVNSQIKILSLGWNSLTSAPLGALSRLSNLLYLGLEGNDINSFGSADISGTAFPVLQHLNLSNNAMESIMPGFLSTFPALRILELHNNHLSYIAPQTFYSLVHLLHLDLNHNHLIGIESRNFDQLPSLIEFRLHSQDEGGLQYLHFEAFRNLSSLQYLWLSQNDLTHFPHAVLSTENYTTLEEVYIDENSISSLLTFDEEAFPIFQRQLYIQRNETHFPFQSTRNLRKLDASSNIIGQLEEGLLCNMTSLEELILSSNFLTETSIFNQSFTCSPQIKILDLGLNLIQYVTSVLSDNSSLPSIESLTLSSNRLTFIQRGAFSQHSNLQTLLLSTNNILTAENGSFPTSLQALNLDSNDFRFLQTGPFLDLTNLQSLSLVSNDISVIPETAFNSCTSLTLLNMQYNNIGWIKRVHFSNCPSLWRLILLGNDLAYIEDSTFSERTGSKSWTLSHNMLEDIPKDGTLQTSSGLIYLDFNRIKSVTNNTFIGSTYSRVFLQNNRIRTIESDAFKMSTIAYLYLHNNPLTTIETNAFTESYIGFLPLQHIGLENFSRHSFNKFSGNELNLEGSNLKSLSTDIFNDITVRYLSLKGSNIENIEGRIFDGASTIITLDLSQNMISYIPEDAFEGVNIDNLILTSNMLTNYPFTALAGKDIKSIDISWNAIENIPEGSFNALINLEYLDLSNNKLTRLPHALFDSLTSLKGLYLQGNQILNFDFSHLSQLQTLEELNLANNCLTYIPSFTNSPALRNLDFSYNKITHLGYNAFAGAEALDIINLNGNPLECDCYLYYSLIEVAMSITGGNCAAPNTTAGLQFGYSYQNSTNYFQHPDVIKNFLCSADAVEATSERSYVVNVFWQIPAMPYPEGIIEDTNATYIFTIECIPVEPPDLPILNDTRSFTPVTTQGAIVFLQPNGVFPGTDYICTVALSINGGPLSARSPPAFVTTPALNETEPTSPPVQDNDFVLGMTVYDFPRSHSDFSGVSSATYSKPDFIPSPYESFLVVSSDPVSDTFSNWYRTAATVNHVFSEIVLVHLEDVLSPTNRFYTEEFYPVDGRGYGHENQRDCFGELHNFGFAVAIRTGFTFHGIGNISVGGGDELWLYINGVLVIEVITNPANPDTPCKTINLEGAQDGIRITPYGGIVVNEACNASEPLHDESFELKLELLDTYHLDLFYAERYGCNSRFYMETQSIDFIQLERGDEPPTDYFITVPEDIHVDAIVTEMALQDIFTPNVDFQLHILNGNEARHFTAKQNDSAAHEAAVPPPTEAPNYTTLDGVPVRFVERTFSDSNATEPSYSGIESVSLSGEIALLTINTSLDYELVKRYTVVMSVVYGTSPEVTGTIVVRVLVTDVNDNYPYSVMKSYEFDQEQRPLQEDPILHFQATDADSGLNAQICYYASTATISPPLSRYNDSHLLDIFNEVYTSDSVVSFTLVAVDKGSPVRGHTVEVTIRVKNSCLISVLGDPIENLLMVNITAGLGFFRIPKYYVNDYECLREAGLSEGSILDEQLSVSSYHIFGPPTGARLNTTRETLFSAWVAESQDQNQWIKVNMTQRYRFRRILIQGRADAEMWVTSFSITYSDDDINYFSYLNATSHAIFEGNDDQDSIVSHELDPPINSQYIRIHPVTWSGGIALRLDFYGCTYWEYNYFLTSCERCETTYYCLGDGSRRPCGRCDPPVDGDTCGRSATEHSFGAQHECSHCPEGWLCRDGYAMPCPKYHYPNCTDTACPEECTWCGEGHACFDGRRSICPPGTYSDGYVEHCSLCREGTYQDLAGQASCKVCPSGHFSTIMKNRCDICPIYTYSDPTASTCLTCQGLTQCPCLEKPERCFPGADCYQDGSGDFMCGPCPVGFTGDGHNCADIDECYEYEPCFMNRCVNTLPGYQCLECPAGYEGTYEDALAWNITRRTFVYGNEVRADVNYQTCSDVNECTRGLHNCGYNAICMNGEGNFTCGNCHEGYIRLQVLGCRNDDFCISGRHDCDENAVCITTGPGTYRCQCPPGYAGDGRVCGEDYDLDGRPDIELNCGEETCKKDNCPFVPNSGQENHLEAASGDACDTDDEGDGVLNDRDNCRFHSNYYQEDGDGDGVGDLCDNCPTVSNADQTDTDGDSMGDACDSDDDNDGISDDVDPCPKVADHTTSGMACDNCETYTDGNQDGYSDLCVTPGLTSNDIDGDGVPNIFDNCQQTSNPDQSDVDQDTIGDLCDVDVDGDGIPNDLDNCIYVVNPGQEEGMNGDGKGEACSGNVDGDPLEDRLDPCPRIASIFTVTLNPSTRVNLYNSADISYHWQINDNGKEVVHKPYSQDPQILIGATRVGSMDYHGTWYVGANTTSNYIGCVFAYQSNRKFYLVQWKRNNSNTDPYVGATRGLTIKRIFSTTGPGDGLRQALWNSDTVMNQGTLLWQDEDMLEWEPFKAYRWHILHRPDTARMRLKVYGNNGLLVDSGDVYDAALTGGKLGVFLQGTEAAIWSNLDFLCAENENYALYFDGFYDYVTLGSFPDYDMQDSFTVALWVSPASSGTSVRMPILCTENAQLCLYVEGDALIGSYGGHVVGNVSSLPDNSWSHVAMRYEAQYNTLTLFINGSVEQNLALGNASTVSWNVTGTNVVLGKNQEHTFVGKLDDVRFYNIWLTDAEIMQHLVKATLYREVRKMYASAHYTMDNRTNPSLLVDSGVSALHGQIIGATYVQSNVQHARYNMANVYGLL